MFNCLYQLLIYNMKTTLKLTVILLTVFAFAMCNTKKSAPFDWLLGKWQRINDKPGRTTFENWEKTSDSTYYGVGFTLQNGDTISQEIMKIIETNGKWNFLVKTPKEEEFISFKIPTIEDDKFECKNDTLDFPKLIKYWKNGDQIRALVSGDSLQLSFEFKRIE